MSISRAAVKLRVTEQCNRNCSLNEINLPIAAQVHAWYEEQRTHSWIAAEAKKAGFPLSSTAVGRHRQKHVELVVKEVVTPLDKVDHLDVLQKIISQGAKNVGTWRIGPSDTLKAMDMYYKLTQGSAFAALFDALSAAASGNADEGLDDAAAEPREEGLLSPAEQEAEVSVDV